jgi:WD40 repeat protein
VAFSPDGKWLVTASWDRTARVWNADGTGEPLVLRGHAGAVYSAAFGPDGKRIVTASWDKTAWVWTDLTELRGADDPKLWRRTNDGISIERRIELLSVSEAAARADQQACQRRVEAARAAAAGPR